MPHIIIEHSKDISESKSLELCQKIITNMTKIEGGNFSLEACKGRVFSFNKYIIGSKNEQNSGFLHVTIKILAGRSVEIKQELAQNSFKIARNFVKDEPKERFDVSIDIVDLDRDCYQK